MQRFLKVTCGLLLLGIALCGSGIVQQAYNLIENAGSPLTRFSTLNFTGSGVTCTNDTGRTTCTINGTGISNYSQSFTGQTSVTLTHSLNSTAVITQCFDGSGNLIVPSNTNITSVNVVTVTFGVAQTGSCNVNGAPGGSIVLPDSANGIATNASGVPQLQTSANVVQEWSGTCNATSVLGADGVCKTITSVPLGVFTVYINQAVPAGGGAVYYASFGITGLSATELDEQSPLPPVSGHLNNFTVVTSTSQSSVGNMVCTVRFAGVNSSLVVTVPANAAAGAFSDTTDNAAFTASQLLAIGCANNGSGASATIQGMSVAVTP